MKNKLLVICGPTSTGKTRLALHLGRIFNGELISADSRQVYKNMDIGTGKDLPENSKFHVANIKLRKVEIGYYKVGKMRIWGYDLVLPKEEFSVASYMLVVLSVINDIFKRNKRPILVGGTGLYIKGVVDGLPTAFVPKNSRLRKLLEGKDEGELFEMLAKLNPIKAASMNRSDRKNPRRLIRAIEVAQRLAKHRQYNEIIPLSNKSDTLFLGLNVPKSLLEENIKRRVKKRIDAGFDEEVIKLLKSGVSWGDQSMQSLGYKQWKDYIGGRKAKDEVIEAWAREEIKYAKRQMVWFKKDKRIKWFDVSEKDYEKKIENLVGIWYSH